MKKYLVFLMILLMVSVVYAQDSLLTISDVYINDLDVEVDGSFIYFVGENISNDDVLLGKVQVESTGQIGDFAMKNIGFVYDGNVLSLDEDNGFLWVSHYDKVERWSNLGGSVGGIVSATNSSYLSTGEGFYYREVVSRPFYDEVAFACRISSPYGSGDFNGVESFKFNSSSGDIDSVAFYNFSDRGMDSTSVCRGLDVQGSYLYVDNGDYGIDIFSIESDNSLTLESSSSNRLGFYMGMGDAYFGRSDLIQVYNDVMFVSDGGTSTTAEAIQRIDISNASSPVYNNTQCVLTGSSIQSKVANIEVFNESAVLFSDMYDSSIYLCEFFENTTTYAVEVWDNPDVAFYGGGAWGDKLEYFTDGNIHYFFTSNGYDNLLMFELKTYFDEGLNAMPYFVGGVPDSQYVDNLNPIVVGIDTNGLDSPVVNVFPLTCVNSNIYDCSNDFEGDQILFAVDKDLDNNVFEASTWYSSETYSATYDAVGNYTMRIYITDVEHPLAYVVYKDFNISVKGNATPLGENESTLRFVVRDSLSGVVLPNVYVDVESEGSGYTNTNGEFVEVVYEGTLLVEFSLNGYVTQTNYYGSSPIFQEVNLELEASGDRRTLQLVVKDVNGSILPDIFVQIAMPLLSDFDFKYTDATGKTVFFPTDDTVRVVVDADGYSPVSFDVLVPVGSLIAREIVLTESGAEITELYEGQSGFAITGCQDYVNGVLLCDYDKTTCSIDEDCLTGQCDSSGHCSNFNWNLCDEDNQKRGNRCFITKIGGGIIRATGNIILDNFFYVLIIVLVLIGILILTLKNK